MVIIFFKAILGYTAQKDNISVKVVQANNFLDDLVHTVSGGQVFAGTAIKEQWSLSSALFRLNYSYEDKYLLQVLFVPIALQDLVIIIKQGTSHRFH